MDVVQPVDAGNRGGFPPPPPPGPEAPVEGRRSVQAIGRFLAAVRRRLLLRAALRTAGYGIAVIGAAVLVLALAAATIGPAPFWPTVTATVLGALALVSMVSGLWRPARAMRRDRDAAHHAGTLLPSLAS